MCNNMAKILMDRIKKEFSISEAARMLKEKGSLFTEVFTHGTLSVEFYKPNKIDLQQPHYNTRHSTPTYRI